METYASGPCACNLFENAHAISSAMITVIISSAAIGKHLCFTANDVGISYSLLVQYTRPDMGQ
jgi:hypothetical protein